jgi:antitoxin HigA-1
VTDTIMPPVHPGEILHEEFLNPLTVSQYQLAEETGVPARRINESGYTTTPALRADRGRSH